MKHYTFDDVMALIGRLLIAALFLPSGLGKLATFNMLAQGLANKGLPLATLLAGAVIALEIFASLAIILGWRVRWAALALAFFTVVAGLLFHNFWQAADAAVMAQRQSFFKNIGIAGGLLLLAAHGPGRLSLSSPAGGGNASHESLKPNQS